MSRPTRRAACRAALGIAGFLLLFSSAGCKPKAPPCECTDSAQCGVSEVCEACACVPGCRTAADCGSEAPNCDSRTGICFGACAVAAECRDPASPVCDALPGLCRPPCPAWPCGGFEPNCDEASGRCFAPCPQTSCAAIGKAYCGSDGRCYDRCESNAGCPNADLPNCDPDTGRCQGPCASDGACPPASPVCDPDSGRCQGACPQTPCPDALPVCEPASGHCQPPCRVSSACRDPSLPNCGPDGRCAPPCTAHADCTRPGRPSCDLDPASPTFGVCMPPCGLDADCPDGAPRCLGGVCEPGCTSDAGCTGGDRCEISSGLCLPVACAADAECAPPRFICNSGGTCVAGCSSHAECPVAERCVLLGAGAGRCEPRDCTSDAVCGPPRRVCDTDGGGVASGGGFCVDGCSRDQACPLGFECAPATGKCSPRDYGDIGQPCVGGQCTRCQSGLGTDDPSGGALCTAQCCTQQECPAGWVCRPALDPDPACPSCTLRLCRPDPLAGWATRAYALCGVDAECRSGVCEGGVCKETCCTDAHCPGEVCSVVSGGRLACLAGPPADDLGATGCATPPLAPTRACRAGLCTAVVSPDAACADVSSCPADANAWCGDFDRQQDQNDCVLDFCTRPCCRAADCTGAVDGRGHFCGKQLYGAYGDFDLCLLAPVSAVKTAGAPCTQNAECASGFCDAGGLGCVARCCTDADCSGGKRCQAAPFDIYGQTRFVSVCR